MKGEILDLGYRYNAGTIRKNVKDVLDDIRSGHPVIIVDDFDRENEGDLMLAGEMATVHNIAFLARWGRGIMCLPTAGEVLDNLKIPMMVQNSTDPLETPFTISVDASKGTTTGVSASDRVCTIQTMLDTTSKPEDLIRPGHLFPLRARDGRLRDRRGHTEASVTLMEVLGLFPLSVIVEIMNDDGSMSRLPELERLATQHHLRIISIEDICEELGIEKSNTIL